MIAVANDIVVSIRYLMTNGRGEVLEDRMNVPATHYIQGSSAIDPGLQAQMGGLLAGERKIIRFRREESGLDDDLIFEVVVDGLRAATKAELLLGYPVIAGDAQCDPDCICHFKPGL